MDLRTIRVLKKASQWELAKASGVPQSRISLAERGLIKLSAHERKALEDALDYTPIDWGRHY